MASCRSSLAGEHKLALLGKNPGGAKTQRDSLSHGRDSLRYFGNQLFAVAPDWYLGGRGGVACQSDNCGFFTPAQA